MLLSRLARSCFRYEPKTRTLKNLKTLSMFRLLRYFALTSLIAFGLVALVLWQLYPQPLQAGSLGSILLVLVLLYVVLFVIIRHAATTMQQQNAELHKLSQAVEQSANTVVITDLHGNIEYVNPKFTETTGYTAEEALGRNPRLLKSGHQPPEVYQDLWQTITSGREWHGEFHNKRKDGTLYWEQATIAPIYDPRGRMTHFIAVKEDITKRKQAEQALKESEERFRSVINQNVDAIIVVDDPGRVRFVNPAARRLFGFETDTLVGKHFSIPVLPGEFTELEIPRRDGSTAVVEIRTVAIEWEQEPAYLESLRDITERKRAEEALRDSQDRLQRAYQREQERRQLSEILREVARIVGSSLEQYEVWDLILAQLKRVVTYHRATLMLLTQDQLRIVAGHDEQGLDFEYVTITIDKYPLNASVVHSKQPLLIPDVTSEPRWRRTGAMKNTRSFILSPLLVRGNVIGILAVGRRDEAPYTDDDTGVVFAFATQVAISMHNAELYAKIHEQNRRLSLLYEISLAVSTTVELSTLLETACRKLVEGFQADHSGMLLFDESYTYGEVMAEYPDHGAVGIRIMLEGYAATEQMIATAQPLAIYDAQHDPLLEKVWDIMRKLDIHSILIVPLVVKGHVIGSFSLDMTNSQRCFDQDELELVQTIASQLAIVIDNTRLLERERRLMEQELQTAQQIQCSLLPREIPAFPGLAIAAVSIPARQVGGDFYNVFRFSLSSLGVAVGDVSGKGMQAALMMTLSFGVLTTKVHRTRPPADLMSTLNVELRPHIQHNKMNTALGYFTLMPESGRDTWVLHAANAGLIAPLIRRRDGRVEWVDTVGLPLGMVPDVHYTACRHTLYPGDLVLLGSDGVVEAMNTEREMYGFDRLTDCVARTACPDAQTVQDAILHDVQTFVGDAEAHDDMTLVVVMIAA